MKREEATLLGYRFLYNRAGQLITERITTDIKHLKKFLKQEEYEILKTIVREGKAELDNIHNKIESHLNARKMGENQKIDLTECSVLNGKAVSNTISPKPHKIAYTPSPCL